MQINTRSRVEIEASHQQVAERVSQRSNKVLTALLKEAAHIETNRDYHTMTPSNFARFLGRKLKRNEISIWRKYRGQIARDRANAKKIKSKEAVIRKQREKELKKEKEYFSLVNLSDEKLLTKVVELYISNREGENKGKNSMNQLVRALNLHSLQEVDQIIAQLKKIKQKTIIKVTRKLARKLKQYEDNPLDMLNHAIKDAINFRKSIKSRERDNQLLSQLNDEDLKEEFSSLYASAVKQWMRLFEKILFTKLDALGNRKTVNKFRKRVLALDIDNKFTQEIKQYTLDMIDLYLK